MAMVESALSQLAEALWAEDDRETEMIALSETAILAAIKRGENEVVLACFQDEDFVRLPADNWVGVSPPDWLKDPYQAIFNHFAYGVSHRFWCRIEKKRDPETGDEEWQIIVSW